MPSTLSLSHPWNTPCTLSTHQLGSNAPTGARANGECASTTTHGAGWSAAALNQKKKKKSLEMKCSSHGVKIKQGNRIILNKGDVVTNVKDTETILGQCNRDL